MKMLHKPIMTPSKIINGVKEHEEYFKFSLKPTIQRIFLTFLLIFIFLFLPIVPVKSQIQCIRAPCNPVDTKIAVFQIFSQNVYLTSWSWFVLIGGIILSYILACFLTTRTREVYP
jgi:hypothetical protein